MRFGRRRQPTTTPAAALPKRQLLEYWLRREPDRTPMSHIAADDPTFVEACNDLVDAVISDHYRVPAALHRFGRRLGLLGMLLEELSAAVDRLSVLVGSPAVLQSFSSGISLASGWSLGHLYGANELECIDPLTGLVTLPVLRLRIEQVADQSAWLGIPLEQTYCVALIDVDSAGADIFEAEVAMMLIAERLKAHFNAGETIARQGSRALVLTTNSERTRTALVELLVDVRSLALPPTTRVIGWIEELSPELHDHAKVVDFLTELTI